MSLSYFIHKNGEWVECKPLSQGGLYSDIDDGLYCDGEGNIISDGTYPVMIQEHREKEEN